MELDVPLNPDLAGKERNHIKLVYFLFLFLSPLYISVNLMQQY